MANRRIGVISAELQELYQTRFVRGINKQAHALGYDVLVFSNFAKGYTQSDFEYGEKYIYELINYEQLDGVLVMGDTFKWPGLIDHTISVLEAAGIPVVFLDYSQGHHFTNLVVEDTIPFENIVSHLIEKHNCKDILFYSGPETVSTTVTRLKGYRNALEKHGMSDAENVCLTGNFWKDSGEAVAKEIIAGERKKPDAIIFCGDYMAIGAMDAFKAAGYNIPEDLIIVGFDATEAAVRYNPPITTYKPPIEAAGENAVFTLDSMIRKIPNDRKSVDYGRMEIGATCGCEPDPEYIRRVHYRNEIGESVIQFLESNMMDELSSARDLSQLLQVIQYYLYLVPGCKDFYLCMNKDWLEDSGISEPEYHPYTKEMNLFIRTENHANRSVEESFPLSQMLPDSDAREGVQTYYFLPLHQGLRSFGYCIITFDSEEQAYDFGFMNWCRHLSNALEGFGMKARIAKLATGDALTGVLTRNGYLQQRKKLSAKIAEEGNTTLVLEMDADGLKYANDHFGHYSGDILLRTIANAIVRSLEEGEICARVGGDEFVVIGCRDYEPDRLEKLMQSIEANMKEANDSGDYPFTISASMGGVMRKISSYEEIEELMQEADARMYEVKKLRHNRRV